MVTAEQQDLFTGAYWEWLVIRSVSARHCPVAALKELSVPQGRFRRPFTEVLFQNSLDKGCHAAG